jgi:hypothetical protein
MQDVCEAIPSLRRPGGGCGAQLARLHTDTHVVRTRIFVTDISRWEEVGRVHGVVEIGADAVAPA